MLSPSEFYVVSQLHVCSFFCNSLHLCSDLEDAITMSMDHKHSTCAALYLFVGGFSDNVWISQ